MSHCGPATHLILLSVWAASLQGEGVLALAEKELLAASQTTRSLVQEIKTANPGFSLNLVSDATLPKATQLRSSSPGHYFGFINLRKMDLDADAPETAIAGLYYYLNLELVLRQPPTPNGWMHFQNLVRSELKQANPSRYGHLRPLRPGGMTLGK